MTLSRRTTAGYGWKRDLDRRGPSFVPKLARLDQLPQTFDWWDHIVAPPCWDQGNTGSCVGHGRARQHRLVRLIAKLTDFEPSRLGIYWQARKIEGSTGLDSGAMIHDAIKAGISEGVGRETDWPWDESKVLDEPPQIYFQNAVKSEIQDYRRVDPTSLQDLMEAITVAPVVFGIPVYESFESAEVERTGVVPMPKDGEAMVGGHCLLFTGYDRTRGAFLVDNSWGRWGMNGRCWIPFGYVTNEADDCWLVTLET